MKLVKQFTLCGWMVIIGLITANTILLTSAYDGYLQWKEASAKEEAYRKEQEAAKYPIGHTVETVTEKKKGKKK